jgi:putative SOS response-associated peptidase YedK
MCGRFTLTLSPEEISQWFDIDVSELEDLVPRYNISPTQNVLVVTGNRDRNRAEMARWGLVPSYWKEIDPKYSMFNAKSEGILASRSFKIPFLKHRCLIPADSFYEWTGPRGDRRPLRIMMKSGEPFAFAGISSVWHDRSTPDSTRILSCSILTTEPNELIRPIHNRMPVILSPESYATWLNIENDDTGSLLEMLEPYDAGLMTAYEVSKDVNSSKEDKPEMIAPLAQ